MSPKRSSPNSIVKLGNAILNEASLSWDPQNPVSCRPCGSIIHMPGDDTPTPKSSTELRKEIATLEAEILHLERCLLSLYRTAFEEHLHPASDVPVFQLQYTTSPSSEVIVKQSHYNSKFHIQRNYFNCHHQSSHGCGQASSGNHSGSVSLHSTSMRDQKNADSGRRSLADHLGTSCMVDSLSTPDRLSEDIVRCISSIYSRLANPLHSHANLSASPVSSMSSSSIFSSHNPCENLSPYCNEDVVVHRQLHGLKEVNGPYATMVDVVKICLDDGSFSYAAIMLNKFRSLVRSLEKVDPRKMKREEKLAFWINIHNALVMHAYLAYGTHDRVKSASILKAAYNVGGHCINPCIIQSSIFGIRSHYSEPWLQTLFSPGRKVKTGSTKHVYALEYPEPLVHFALCSGTYSDPAVRVYTAKNIFEELKLAKEEYIQSSIYIHKDAKISLPKIISYYAKDMSMDTPRLLEGITTCLAEVQQERIRKCMTGKLDKCINWLPQSSSFRYVIHGELVQERMVV